MTNKDQEILRKIGTIDMDKVAGILQERSEDIDEKLSALQDIDDKLTDWEIDFINTCTDYFESRGNLTDKQYVIVLQIYTKWCL